MIFGYMKDAFLARWWVVTLLCKLMAASLQASNSSRRDNSCIGKVAAAAQVQRGRRNIIMRAEMLCRTVIKTLIQAHDQT